MILDTFCQKIRKIKFAVFEKTRWRLKTSKNHLPQKPSSYHHQIWSAHTPYGPTSWAQTSSRSDRKWIFGEFFSIRQKKSFSPIGRSCPGRTGSDINMRISLSETRNTVTCLEQKKSSHFISTSGQKIPKVKKVKIAFFQKVVIFSHMLRGNRKQYSFALFSILQQTVSFSQHKKSHDDRTGNRFSANFQTSSISSSRVRHLGHQLTSRVTYGTQAHGNRLVRQRTVMGTTYQKSSEINFDSFRQMGSEVGQFQHIKHARTPLWLILTADYVM